MTSNPPVRSSLCSAARTAGHRSEGKALLAGERVHAPRSLSSPLWVLGLACSLFLAALAQGCKQRPTETEEPSPPVEIYVDPARAASAQGPGTGADSEIPVGAAAAPPPATTTADGSSAQDPSDAASADSSGSADFKSTLEGMPADEPSRDREGVAGLGSCASGHRVGESWKHDCNTCTCEASGETTCTMIACIRSDSL